MTTWHVKELATLTGVSVRTLHHYDKIDLVKPSFRESNQYRLYRETDLLKLQQVIALKFFGFNLKQIKRILDENIRAEDHFAMQATALKQQAKATLAAAEMLDTFCADIGKGKSVSWQQLIELIGVYNMTTELENTWAGKVFNSDELKTYAAFIQGLDQHSPEHQTFHQRWGNAIKTIQENHRSCAADSPKAIQIAEETMTIVNSLYDKPHYKLRNAIWARGFKAGKMDDMHGLTPEMVTWLDKAMDAYYTKRCHDLFARFDAMDSAAFAASWETLSYDITGGDADGEAALFAAIEKDKSIDARVKTWLRDRKA